MIQTRITRLIMTSAFLILSARAQQSPPALISETDWTKTDSVTQALAKPNLTEQMKTLAARPDVREAASQPGQRLRFELLLGDYEPAAESLKALSQAPHQQPFRNLHMELYLEASKQQRDGKSEEAAFSGAFRELMAKIADRDLAAAGYYSGYSMEMGYAFLQSTLQRVKADPTLTPQSAVTLIVRFVDVWVYQSVLQHTLPLLEAEYRQRFQIEDRVLIKTPDGAQLSAIVALPRGRQQPLPTAMMFNIYTDPLHNLREAVDATSRGYAGVVADARGKRLSPDPIQPYETECSDVNAVIDWVARQPWSNGAVGMYGGSYLGFAQWAALKHPHPALKTIVPYAAAIPGQGLPMENNIFLTVNYGWAEFVTTNKTLNHAAYADPSRQHNMQVRYYQEGLAFRQLDRIDGTPNPWLQRWLKHPAYDAYWQAMVPFREEYRQIDIPILTITGYYDDGQISALHYLEQHDRFHPNPQHYLVIGPYDHRSTQATQDPELRGYHLDESAHIDVKELTFQWLDHVLKGGMKPNLLQARINLQVMGGNRWHHLGSWRELMQGKRRFYFTHEKTDVLSEGEQFALAESPVEKVSFHRQSVDLADPDQEFNDYYPWPIVKSELDIPNGLAFVSQPFGKDTVIQGRFNGEIRVRINKKDMDLGLVFYERTAEGKYFHLSYYLGRASYAEDMTQRKLLTPSKIEHIRFERTRMTGKLLKKGSRLVVLVNINKNRYAQVNYGTGGDVSDETRADAGEPLQIDWFDNSYIEVPFTDWNPTGVPKP